MIEDEKARLRGLKARALALQSRLVDLKDRRDRGRLTDGQYTDLAADLDRERIEILEQLREVLGSRDKDLDRILVGAMGGAAESELGRELLGVAEEKGLGEEIGSQIRQHRGTIISWIVDIGLALGRKVL